MWEKSSKSFKPAAYFSSSTIFHLMPFAPVGCIGIPSIFSNSVCIVPIDSNSIFIFFNLNFNLFKTIESVLNRNFNNDSGFLVVEFGLYIGIGDKK